MDFHVHAWSEQMDCGPVVHMASKMLHNIRKWSQMGKDIPFKVKKCQELSRRPWMACGHLGSLRGYKHCEILWVLLKQGPCCHCCIITYFPQFIFFPFPYFQRLPTLVKRNKAPLPSLLFQRLWFSKPRCSVKESYKITEPGAEAPTISSAFCPDKSPRNKWEPGKKPMAPFKGSACGSETEDIYIDLAWKIGGETTTEV